MKKKKTARPKRPDSKTRSKSRKYVVIGCVTAIMLFACGTIAGPWSSWLGTRRIRSAFFSPPPAPLPSPNSPAKEYVYAGTRLVATEEPNPVTLAAPLLVAAATFSQSRIDVTWNASANAHHYVVERASMSGESNFAVINSNVTGTTYPDTTVTSINAYLYRVRAADAAGNLSPASNIDVATAITFADDPFPAPPTLTLVRASHVTQLRQAINAVRHTVPGMQDYAWTQPINVGSSPIKANDLEEMRLALDQALNQLNLPSGGYTDSSLSNLLFQKLYITELRNRVK